MVLPRDVTVLLGDWSRGDRTALDALLPLVYAELRRVAARQLRRERADHTLQPTALVNEVFIRLVDQRQVDWQNRAHFFGVAANVMRRSWSITPVVTARANGAMVCAASRSIKPKTSRRQTKCPSLHWITHSIVWQPSTLNWPRSSSSARFAG